MKNQFKKVTALALTAAMMISGSAMAFAEDTQPQVMLDGKYVAFEDAEPENVNGRIMVPYRAMLETLGAEVSWDQAAKEVTAKTAEETLQFTIGEPDVQITYTDGTTKTINMDVVPYVKDGRTYVGTRFMAEALDYTVGWDAAQKTAVIIDYNKIFENFDEDFSVLNQIAAAESSVDMEKPYKTQMDLNVDVTLYEALVQAMFGDATGTQYDVSVAGTVTGVSQGMNADLVMTLKLDVSKLLDQVTEEQRVQIQEIADTFGTVDMKIKMNGESGETYVYCNLFSILDSSIPENSWMKFNVYELYDSMGVDLKSLFALSENMADGAVSVKDMIVSAFESAASSMTIDSYAEGKAVYGLLEAMVGDDAFTVKTSGSTTTYTTDFNGNDVILAVISQLQKEGLDVSGQSIQDLKTAFEEMMSFEGAVSVSVRNNQLVDSSMDLTFAMEGMKMQISGGGTDTDMNMALTLDMQDMAKVVLTMDAVSTQTTETIDVNPPAGANIIDMTDMLGSAVQL